MVTKEEKMEARDKGMDFKRTLTFMSVNQGQQVHGTIWYNQGKEKGRQEGDGNAQYWGIRDLPFHPLNQGGKGKGFRGGKGGF